MTWGKFHSQFIFLWDVELQSRLDIQVPRPRHKFIETIFGFTNGQKPDLIPLLKMVEKVREKSILVRVLG